MVMAVLMFRVWIWVSVGYRGGMSFRSVDTMNDLECRYIFFAPVK